MGEKKLGGGEGGDSEVREVLESKGTQKSLLDTEGEIRMAKNIWRQKGLKSPVMNE